MNKKDKLGMYFNHTSKNGWVFLHFDENLQGLNRQQPLMWYDMFRVANVEHSGYMTIE